MKQITKKQCEEALKLAERCEYWDKFGEIEEYQVLEQLIKELFDNPPLKFEEIEAGMWVWSKIYDRYIHIVGIEKVTGGGEIIKGYFGFEESISDYRFYKFEDGDVFRKQVE